MLGFLLLNKDKCSYSKRVLPVTLLGVRTPVVCIVFICYCVEEAEVIFAAAPNLRPPGSEKDAAVQASGHFLGARLGKLHHPLSWDSLASSIPPKSDSSGGIPPKTSEPASVHPSVLNSAGKRSVGRGRIFQNENIAQCK